MDTYSRSTTHEEPRGPVGEMRSGKHTPFCERCKGRNYHTSTCQYVIGTNYSPDRIVECPACQRSWPSDALEEWSGWCSDCLETRLAPCIECGNPNGPMTAGYILQQQRAGYPLICTDCAPF